MTGTERIGHALGVRRVFLAFLLAACHPEQAKPLLPGPKAMVLLPIEVKSTNSIRALLFNADDEARLVVVSRPSDAPERVTPATTQPVLDIDAKPSIRTLTVLLGPAERTFVRARFPSGQVDSNSFVLESITTALGPIDPPQLVLAPQGDDFTVWILGAGVASVTLVDEAQTPLPARQRRCEAHPAGWLKSIVTRCEIVVYGPLSTDGFRGTTIAALLDGTTLTNQLALR
jgi:hypothetical protein